eukprot:TRINITY_DN34414_c0_g1_i1.p1 TRINITY_DN34414_c0_g1~~TRINITY_DN34414_c0_g1_i1.p1  ORF type:complete len:406 (-),score=72.04 TRINITY_DN34414_c0_g1_i1:74-1291(-)
MTSSQDIASKLTFWLSQVCPYCSCLPVSEVPVRSKGSTSVASSAPAPARLPLPLDVGFAKVALREAADSPRLVLEISVIECDDQLTEDDFEISLETLLQYLDFVLDLQQVSDSEGFQLRYLVPTLNLMHQDVITRLVEWSCDPARQAKWHQKCKEWKILVAEGVAYQVARLQLNVTFYLYPPPCVTYLLTEGPEAVEQESVVWYPDPGVLEAARLWQDLEMQESSQAQNRRLPSPRKQQREVGEERSKIRIREEWKDDLPPSLDVGFAVIHQGVDSEGAYLKIFGKEDSEITEEGLSSMMDFMDAFVFSERAEKGYSITYDLRALRSPPMHLVTRIGEWGAEPVRQKTWESLNTSCKVCINQGLKFTMAKGILTTFFYICPPVCKTLLLTDPDQTEETGAAVFMP